MKWLEEIEQRAAKATPAPWVIDSGDDIVHRRQSDGRIEIVAPDGMGDPCQRPLPDDAAFIAAARTDVPALISTIRVLKEALAELQESADQMVFGGHGGVYLPMQQLRWQRADSSTKQLLSRLERGPLV